MGGMAVVLGSNALGERGQALGELVEGHGAVALQRHGTETFHLPHRIDHAANLRALAEAGCDRVLAIASVGSLRAELDVGTFLCPSDFVALQLTITTFEDARGHSMPGFETGWRGQVVSAWGAHASPPLHDGGVYWQTNGPRFETPAEIRLLAAHADVVGMTVAAECIVAGELGLRYATVCIVDNLANGIGQEPLSIEELEAARQTNFEQLRDALDATLPELAR